MYQMQEVFAKQFEDLKAGIMGDIVQLEKLLTSIDKKYFDPRTAPSSIGNLWSDSVNAVWSEIAKLEKYSIIPQFRNFIEMVEQELLKLNGLFWRWTNRKVIDTGEAADKYGRHRNTIYRWIKSGKLEAKKVNGRWQIAA